MNTRALLLVVAGCFSLIEPTLAYEPTTHAEISKSAADFSVLAKPDILRSIGLNYPIDSEQQKFPNSKNDSQTILSLIQDGARFEDDGTRSTKHFFDPLNGRGLWGVNTPSPDWALEESRIEGQYFSFKNARDYLYGALTRPDEKERKKIFGNLFQSLGQVIHHIQDMAQPQHVRNDDHCDRWFCKPYLHSPSRYEKYTKDEADLSALLNNRYGPVTFDQARKFWHTNEPDLMDRQGIADYTNRGFVSAGTNFKYLDGQVSLNTKYKNPSHDGDPKSVPIAELYQELGKPVPIVVNPETGQEGPLEGSIDFYKNVVSDAYAKSETKTNQRAASLSIFDADLRKYNTTAPG